MLLMDAQAARGARFEEGNVVEKNVKGFDVIVSAVSDDGQGEIIGSGYGDGSAGIYRKHRNFKNVSVDI